MQSARRTRGVVAAGDRQTAEAGAELLRQGGNAIDAAIASAFAAFVCELPLCSPLGGGALLVEPASGEARAIDMFARAPGLGGTRPSALDFDDVEVSFGAATQVFHVGRASAAVPLALPGLLEAHRRWGTRPLADVVAPAAALARDGFILDAGVAYVFGVLTPIVERTPECRALYAEGGVPTGPLARTGSRLTNPALATALEDLARKPAFVRDLLAAFARELGPDRGGLVTARDVEAASIVDAEPIRVAHGAWELATMPAPSTGGALVALGLRLHENDGELAFLSRDHVLSIARVQEVLLEERVRVASSGAAALGDENLTRLRARLAEKRDACRAAPDTPLGSTTHVSVIDEHGAAVALTLTNGEGCGHVVPGTGMIANNLLGEEDIHPHGFHLDPPGAPLSTMMAPTILRSADRRIALGSGGSSRLRNAILQVAVALVEHGVDVARAVTAPRVQIDGRSERSPRAAFETDGLPEDAVAALLAAYPDAPAVFGALNFYFGGVHAAVAAGGRFSGAGDPRRSGAAVIV